MGRIDFLLKACNCTFSAIVVAAVILSTPVWALDPHTRLQDYNHTVFGVKQGAPGEVYSIAQTTDGWIWLGTNTGLYQFDGVRFERYVPPSGSKLLDGDISELAAQSNGDLWIAYISGGLSVRHSDGRLEHVAQGGTNAQIKGTFAVAIDTDKTIWVAGMGGLFHQVNGVWNKVGDQTGPSGPLFINVLLDQYGQLWAGNENNLFILDRQTGKLRRSNVAGQPGSLVMSPDGRLWSGDEDHFRVVPSPPGISPIPRNPWFNQTEGHGNGIFDRDGNLWALRCPHGICFVARAGNFTGTDIIPSKEATDRFDKTGQMGTLSARQVMEDREGNIWVATPAGLERFRDNKVTLARVPGDDGMLTMASDVDGTLWTAEYDTLALWRVGAGTSPMHETTRPSTIVANGWDGSVWIAGTRYLEHRTHGVTERLPLPPGPDGRPIDQFVSKIYDDGVRIWVALRGRGRFTWMNGKWDSSTSMGWPEGISFATPGAKGQVWAGRVDGSLFLYDNGKLRNYSAADVTDLGHITCIEAGANLLVAGRKGLAVMQQARFQRIVADDSELLNDITGMATSADGDHWLNSQKGIVHIKSADWHALLANPGSPLVYELIDATDGYPGYASSLSRVNTALQGSDGILWFLTTGGIVSLDPSRLKHNPVPPKVEIRALDTGIRTFVPNAGLILPAGTSKLRIDYTALSYTKPEQVRFLYRLDGVDTDWQDARTNRAAFYTKLQPGDYRFSVKARNEDGVWSEHDGELAFRIEPTMVQTIWFKLLCGAVVILVLWLLYRLRLRQVTKLIHMRLDERLDERERIARDLHDTVLQSVQGMILNVEALAISVAPDAPIKKALEDTARQAQTMMIEGRDRVRDLRAEHIAEKTLTEALQIVGLEHSANGVKFDLSSCGKVRPLHPIVQDELIAMGRECLLNAFRHADAREVSVELHFGVRDFKLVVSDNGIGIPDEVIEARGRSGHWGLASLYERAAKINANLELVHRSLGGTQWCVSVPASLAYRKERVEVFARKFR